MTLKPLAGVNVSVVCLYLWLTGDRAISGIDDGWVEKDKHTVHMQWSQFVPNQGYITFPPPHLALERGSMPGMQDLPRKDLQWLPRAIWIGLSQNFPGRRVSSHSPQNVRLPISPWANNLDADGGIWCHSRETQQDKTRPSTNEAGFEKREMLCWEWNLLPHYRLRVVC